MQGHLSQRSRLERGRESELGPLNPPNEFKIAGPLSFVFDA